MRRPERVLHHRCWYPDCRLAPAWKLTTFSSGEAHMLASCASHIDLLESRKRRYAPILEAI